MKTPLGLIAAIGIVLAGPAYASTNLVSNGSFELGTDPGSFITEHIGGTDITDWSVLQENVDYIGSYWQASDGTRSIDLSGYFANGVIQQSINTVAGQTYNLTFDVSANPDSGTPNPRLGSVYVDGNESLISYQLNGNTKDNMEWQQRSLSFVASGSTTSIAFGGSPNDNLAYGIALDNVSVTAVPEPATWTAMLIGFSLLGFALRTRRQAAFA